MSITGATRAQIIETLPGERGQRLVLLPWWVDALAALDDPTVRELLLVLVRQAGKSQLLMAMAITELLLVPNSYVILIAASEAQQQALYHRKLRRPLERVLDAMGQRKIARFTQRGVEIEQWGSALEVLAPNESTVPGRTVTKLMIDEARYVPDSVFVALAPSVLGAGGKIIVASTTGPRSGWFYQLVQNPAPESWVYRSDQNQNPCANTGVLDYLRRRLALVSPAAARRELHAEFLDDGDELIPGGLIDAAIDDTLGELPTHRGDAYAFLDLSRKRDLTSLVVVVSVASQRPDAADHLIVASVQTWDPRQSPTGEVDFAEVREALARLPQRFPNLRRLLVDEGAEAGSVLPFARSHPALAMRVEGFVASVAANQDIWSALLARLNGRTLSIPRHDRLLAELRGLRREEFALGSRWRVVDASRRLHRDVSLSLAGAVWAAGAVTRCAYCGDPDCDGITPPFGLMGSMHVREWLRMHPDPDALPRDAQEVEPSDAERVLVERLDAWCLLADRDDPAADALAVEIEALVVQTEQTDPAVGARLRDVVTAARSCRRGWLMLQRLRRVVKEWRGTAGVQPAARAEQELRNALKQVQPARETEELIEHLREEHRQKAERERREASAREVRDAIAHTGVWWPGDRTGRGRFGR